MVDRLPELQAFLRLSSRARGQSGEKVNGLEIAPVATIHLAHCSGPM